MLTLLFLYVCLSVCVLAPLSCVTTEKCHQIEAALSEDPVDALKLKKLALSEGGLVKGNFVHWFVCRHYKKVGF